MATSTRQNLQDYWPDAYRPDPIEMLRERIRNEPRHPGIAIALGILTWAVIIGCFLLIASGTL